MPHRPLSWKVILVERWLFVVLTLTAAAVVLAYQHAEQFRLDLRSPLHATLLEGFYPPEESPTGTFRWTSGESHIRLPNLWPGQATDLILTLSAPRPEGANTGTDGAVPVEVIINGQSAATLTLGPAPQPYPLRVDAGTAGPAGDLFVTLRTPAFSVPSDLRELGSMLGGLAARPAPANSRPFWPSPAALCSLVALAGLSYAWARRLGAGTWLSLMAAAIPAITGSLGLLAARAFVTPLSHRLLAVLIVACLGSELFGWAAERASATTQDGLRARRLSAALLGAAFAVRLILAHAPGDYANFLAFKMMIENVTMRGVAAAYGIPAVIGAYPPVHHYDFALVGHLYRIFVSPEFDVASRRLNFVMKMPTIVFDMLIVLTIMAYAVRRRDLRAAMAAGAVYAFNPGIIYTTAYNGQLGDPLYALFVTLAVTALLSGAGGLTGAATALAVLTKPQASAFLPFLALGALRHLPTPRLVRGVLAGVVVVALVLLPFLLAGTVGELLQTVASTVGHGPRISSEAHNIWWLWGWGQAWEIKDSQPWLGPVSYRTGGLILFFGLAYGLIGWRTWTAQRREDLAILAALAGLAFFMLPTEIHENYLFPMFPLLALAAVHDRRAWLLTAVLGLSWTANLIIIDQTLLGPMLTTWPALHSIVFPLRIISTFINVAVLLAWGSWSFGTAGPASVSRTKATVQ